MNYAPTTQGWYEQQMGIKFPSPSSGNNTQNPSSLNSDAASRTTFKVSPPKFLDQFSDFPAWMPRDNQSTNQGALNTYKAGIPAAFSTSNVEKAYNNQIAGMMAQGRGHAAAAATAYGNKAMQAGASGAGAGFAQAQAMLPMYDKANAMQSDLAGIQMNAKAKANEAQGNVASQQSKMAAQREEMMTDYATTQQRFALMNRQMEMEQNAQARAALAASRGAGMGDNSRRGAYSEGAGDNGTWTDLLLARNAINPGNAGMYMNSMRLLDQLRLAHREDNPALPKWAPGVMGMA